MVLSKKEKGSATIALQIKAAEHPYGLFLVAVDSVSRDRDARLVGVVLCSNRAATQADIPKIREKYHTENVSICGDFAMPGNAEKPIERDS
jgi:hypothetical protein